jgi:Cobalamin synthesis protein cobW C-terminal domain
MRKLLGSIYRAKGVVYNTDERHRRAVIQVVGRRVDIALEQQWGERTPRTQIVAIGAAGSINADLLEATVTSCVTGTLVFASLIGTKGRSLQRGASPASLVIAGSHSHPIGLLAIRRRWPEGSRDTGHCYASGCHGVHRRLDGRIDVRECGGGDDMAYDIADLTDLAGDKQSDVPIV